MGVTFFCTYILITYSSVLAFVTESVFTVSAVSDFPVSSFFVSVVGAFFPP